MQSFWKGELVPLLILENAFEVWLSALIFITDLFIILIPSVFLSN